MNPVAPCHSLAEVRTHIDRLDRALVALIAERGAYVRQAARFKQAVADVPAPPRVAEVLERVRGHAEALGADPELVTTLWRTMIDAFITSERAEHAALHPPSPTAP